MPYELPSVNAVTMADDAMQGIALIGELAIVTGGYCGGFADVGERDQVRGRAHRSTRGTGRPILLSTKWQWSSPAICSVTAVPRNQSARVRRLRWRRSG
ncbi:hypothetical protein GCM10023335_41080 [Streptomyces siamensis]|uniref:Uncharacterized protein n=1 Tax=Streptomyces siamensis TaxID=1274986 RepID=A0ABP9J1G5_9ACTN